MAKQKKDGGIDLANIEANLDDVFAALGPPAGEDPPAPPPPPPVAAPAGKRGTAVPPPGGAKPSGRRAARGTAAGSGDGALPAPPAGVPTTGVPTTGTAPALSPGELAWFFQPPALDGGTTQVYLSTPTKEALFAVARRVGGIPAGQLADNILRWWIINNKQGLRGLMERDPLEELEL